MKKLLFIFCWVFVTKANAQIISTIAGTGTQSFTGDGGQATAAGIGYSYGIATDKYGNVYFAENNSTIRRIDAQTGIVSTIAGIAGTAGYSGDGAAATLAKLNYPGKLTFDTTGNLYIADQSNNCIRKIIISTGIISTVAGNGTYGFSGDGGQATAAKLASPAAVAIDVAGNIFIADANNKRIRKVNTAGIITTIAGNGTAGYIGDGGAATAAEFGGAIECIAFDKNGNLFITDNANYVIRKINTAGKISTYAGNGSSGLSGIGGAATSAGLGNLGGMAVDKAGNLFIGNQNNYLFKVNSTTGIFSLFGGGGVTGSTGDGGPAISATFSNPMAIACDTLQNIYFTDITNCRIRKITYCASPISVVINGINTLCGGMADTLTATGASSYLWSASAGSVTTNSVIVNPLSNTIYNVTGISGGCIALSALTVTVNPILSLTPYTNITVCSGSSTVISAGGATSYTWMPGGLTTNSISVSPTSMTVYTVTGANANCTSVATLTAYVNPVPLLNVVASQAVCAGSAVAAITFSANLSNTSINWTNNNTGIGIGSSGSGSIASYTPASYISTQQIGIITATPYTNGCYGAPQTFSITVNPSPTGGSIVGTSSLICTGDSISLNFSKSAVTYTWLPGNYTTPTIAVAPSVNTVYTLSVADNACPAKTFTYAVTVGNCKEIITTIAGNGTYGFTGDGGAATSAEITSPYSVATDKQGNLYIADNYNNRIRKVSVSGIITTIAGNGTAGYTGDGGQATAAELKYPQAIAFDNNGNIFIADSYNNRIRKINTAGIISTYAGNGTLGYSGDGGPATAAKLHYPSGMALDGVGNLYFAEPNNHAIRMINTSGIITTIAGTGTAGYSGNAGLATAAMLNYPQNVVIDNYGNMFISDVNNNCIRKINTMGIISTYAGTDTAGYTGNGGQAGLADINVGWVAIDKQSNIYLVEQYTNDVRKIDNTGIISLVAGNLTGGYSGDGGPAVLAQLKQPSAVCLDTMGNIYIADNSNYAVRKISTCQNPINIQVNGSNTICNGNSITLQASGGNGSTYSWNYSSVTTNTIGLLPTNSTTYPIICTSGGCITQKHVAVNVIPFTLNVSGNESICTSTTTTLTASGSSTSYTWMPGNINTAADVISPTANTIYTVTGANATCMQTHTIAVYIYPCNTPTTCTGYDFSNGKFNGWVGKYSLDTTGNGDSGLPPSSFTGYGILNRTGIDSSGLDSLNHSHEIFDGGNDYMFPSIQCVAPGHSKSVKLGKTPTYSWTLGYGHQTLSKTFTVTGSNANYTYWFAFVSNGSGHIYSEEPYFQAKFYDVNNNEITSAAYRCGASTSPTVILDPTTYIVHQDWTQISANLSAYIGQNVTVTFETADCDAGGHFGYAYVDIDCGTAIPQITQSSNNTCAPDTLLAPTGYATYNWLGAGITGATNTYSTTVNTAGTYSLILTNTSGTSYTLNTTVAQVNTKPIASYVVNQVCNGSASTFTNQTTNSPTNYLWSFGDSDTSSALNPTHIYTTAGTYTATLKASNACGSDSVKQTVTVLSNPILTVNPGYTICPASSVSICVSGASTYTWSPSNYTGACMLANPSTPTNYTIVGTDAKGCNGIALTTVQVVGNPTVSINAPNSVCVAACTTFSAVTNPVINNYAWDFGNGQSAVVASPVYCYTNTGVSVVTLTVTDVNGCTNSATASVTVNALPIVIINSSFSGCLPVCNTFTATSSNVINTYAWDFGNGQFSSVASPVECYTVAGSSIATLTVTDVNGCVSTTTSTVTVVTDSLPSVSLQLVADTAVHTWDLYADYSSSVTNATWYWGDGTDTTAIYPTHIYAAPGKYNICVTVFNACGDSVSTCQNDSVYRYSNNSISSSMVYVNVLHGNPSTGISKLVNNNEVNIYPNPAQNNFTIELTGTEKQTLLLCDVHGRVVLNQIISGKTNINTNDLMDGVYNISIINSIGTINKRLVIVK